MTTIPASLRRAVEFMILLLAIVLASTTPALPAAKVHTVSFGKWTMVQFSSDSEGTASSVTVKVRPLLIDARIKEFTFGLLHDVTDRHFVVRRAFRVNDSLPQEAAAPPRWRWEPGGWLLVDRTSGHISPLNLPEFDAAYSEISWYRDYAAYCGLSDDGKKSYAIVAEIARRKPILKTLIAETKLNVDAQNEPPALPPCMMPEWQREPARVTFGPNPSAKTTYVIRGHSVDLLNDDEEDEASR